MLRVQKLGVILDIRLILILVLVLSWFGAEEFMLCWHTWRLSIYFEWTAMNAPFLQGQSKNYHDGWGPLHLLRSSTRHPPMLRCLWNKHELWSHLSCFGHLQMYQAWSLMPPQPPPTLLWHRPCQQTFWVHVPPRTGRFLDCGPRQKDCTPIEATTARLPTDLFRKRHATAYTFWCCRVHSMRRWNTRQCGEVHTLRWPCC